jgi:hypothetical protein
VWNQVDKIQANLLTIIYIGITYVWIGFHIQKVLGGALAQVRSRSRIQDGMPKIFRVKYYFNTCGLQVFQNEQLCYWDLEKFYFHCCYVLFLIVLINCIIEFCIDWRWWPVVWKFCSGISSKFRRSLYM